MIFSLTAKLKIFSKTRTYFQKYALWWMGSQELANIFFEVLVFGNFSALTFVNLSWALSSAWKDSWVALFSVSLKRLLLFAIKIKWNWPSGLRVPIIHEHLRKIPITVLSFCWLIIVEKKCKKANWSLQQGDELLSKE